MRPCGGCGSLTAHEVWGFACCGRCFAEIAGEWPESGDAERRYPDERERYEAYRKFTRIWLEKRKERAA